MHETLESLARACRGALARDNTRKGRQQVLALVQAALRDRNFLTAQFSGPSSERRVLYEDPDLGFCILAHEYFGAKQSGPHDHGPSWAIYGQAEGETLMCDFAVVKEAAPDKPGQVRVTRSYRLRAGDVHLYNEGDLHAPGRNGATRLIRIEGMNMDRVKRLRYEVISD